MTVSAVHYPGSLLLGKNRCAGFFFFVIMLFQINFHCKAEQQKNNMRTKLCGATAIHGDSMGISHRGSVEQQPLPLAQTGAQ